MSYYMAMGFTNVKDKLEAFEKAQKFTEVCYENYRSLIDEGRYIGTGDMYTDDYFLGRLFTFDFIYWKEHGLLGIKGDNYPDVVKDIIDVFVPFQDATDQNYDYSVWGNTIDVFNAVIEEAEKLTDDEVLEISAERYGITIDEVLEDSSIDYERKSYVYRKISSMLNMEPLIEDEAGNFERFSITALNTEDRRFQVRTYLKALAWQREQEEKQKETE